MQPRIKGRFGSVPLLERMESKVDKSGDCWLWTGAKDKLGYGNVGVNGKVCKAYRVYYELKVGEIPKGLDIDHLCENPPCINPVHLEPVTHRENIRRGYAKKRRTHCFKGHLLSKSNTYVSYNPIGTEMRTCRTCSLARSKARHNNKQDGGSSE